MWVLRFLHIWIHLLLLAEVSVAHTHIIHDSSACKESFATRNSVRSEQHNYYFSCSCKHLEHKSDPFRHSDLGLFVLPAEQAKIHVATKPIGNTLPAYHYHACDSPDNHALFLRPPPQFSVC
ncbi:MAG: hypothetical protein ACRDDZ_00805 [Marinifilaceae bacterium]